VVALFEDEDDNYGVSIFLSVMTRRLSFADDDFKLGRDDVTAME
jgi:hypothetical protein